MNYYNENDPYVVQWLHNLIDNKLIPKGHVDDRSIKDVEPSDLKDFTQCHFFAGIGGWSRALELAGWAADRPVWTGSCPCQPFSNAGKQKGFDDERHLWPEWFRLIRKCKPSILFGEQVASAELWLDLCASDLENESYAFASAILPACSVGAPHKRNRFWFVAISPNKPCIMANTSCDTRGRDAGTIFGEKTKIIRCKESNLVRSGTSSNRSLADPDKPSLCKERKQRSGQFRGIGKNSQISNYWENGSEWFIGSDGKSRCIKSGICLLANGIPNRGNKLRALGNSIIPQVAAEFIKIFT